MESHQISRLWLRWNVLQRSRSWRQRHGDWMKFENMNVESFLSAFVEGGGALIVMWYFSICKCSTTDNEHRKRSWKGRRKFISGRLGLLIGVWGCFCGDIEWHKYLVGSRNFDGRYLFRYSFRKSVSLKEDGNCTRILVGWCFDDVIVKQFRWGKYFYNWFCLNRLWIVVSERSIYYSNFVQFSGSKVEPVQ